MFSVLESLFEKCMCARMRPNKGRVLQCMNTGTDQEPGPGPAKNGAQVWHGRSGAIQSAFLIENILTCHSRKSTSKHKKLMMAEFL